MAPSAQEKWDEHYRKAKSLSEPSAVLRDNLHLLPTAGRSVDLACGISANACLLRKEGLDSEAWDISPRALRLQRKFGVQVLHRDVEARPPEAHSFDVIVVAQFLNRGICEALGEALRDGGRLFYQTFLAHKTTLAGPSSEQYLLLHDELPTLFPKLQVLHYTEDADRAYFVGSTSR